MAKKVAKKAAKKVAKKVVKKAVKKVVKKAVKKAPKKVAKEAVEKVVSTGDDEFIELHARRMVEMAGYIIMSYLLVLDANRDSSHLRHRVSHLKQG